MSLINDQTPSNTEAVRLGAQRIREDRTLLNATLGQMFDSSFVFLTKWVAGDSIQSDSSNDALRAISTDHLKSSIVSTSKMAAGALSADAAGRAIMADAFVTQAKLDPTVTAIPAANSVGASQLQALAVTVAKAASGVCKVAVGTYSGSNSVSATVSGLAFAPDILILTRGSGTHGAGIAFRVEGSPGPVHATSEITAITSPLTSAIVWNSDGFTVAPANIGFNNGGQTHCYIALKV